jgi:hypothetical protein
MIQQWTKMAYKYALNERILSEPCDFNFKVVPTVEHHGNYVIQKLKHFEL